MTLQNFNAEFRTSEFVDRENLQDILLPYGIGLVQYVDDQSFASQTYRYWFKDTICLCTALAEKGTSLSKLQLCLQEVKYLEFKIDRPRTGPGYCRNTLTSNKEMSVRIFKHSKILQTLDTGVLGEVSKPWTEAAKAEEVETIH